MGVTIRRAHRGDRGTVNRLLHEAFFHDPVSLWVFPDEAYRRASHGVLMGAFIDMAFDDGWVDITEDGSAAALWISVAAGDHPTGEDGPAQTRAEVDPDNERIEQVGRLTGDIHPTDRDHEYLQMIAVAPGRQGEGLGTALIESVLERCDREGRPAYLEASSARSRGLYERLGYTFMGRTVDLPDGPRMWPMWRDPR